MEFYLDKKSNKIISLLTLNWYTLKEIGNNKYVGSMYIWIFVVPVIAKTFEFVNKQVLNFEIFGEVIAFNTGLPFSWKVFYFSALSFALANLIINLKCPSIIKDHSSFRDFSDAKKTINHLFIYAKDISFDFTILNDRGFMHFDRAQIEIDPIEDVTQEDLSYYFSAILNTGNITYKSYRLICSILFHSGAVLFSWVILENTIVVVRFILK